jgi:hypothetical protein
MRHNMSSDLRHINLAHQRGKVQGKVFRVKTPRRHRYSIGCHTNNLDIGCHRKPAHSLDMIDRKLIPARSFDGIGVRP